MQSYNDEIANKLRSTLVARGQEVPMNVMPQLQAVVDVTPIGFIKAATITGTATARTDTYVVPRGKIWKVLHAFYVRSNASDAYLNVRSQGTALTRIVSLPSASSGNFVINPFYLATGDAVAVECNTAASGTIITYVSYEEYEVTA